MKSFHFFWAKFYLYAFVSTLCLTQPVKAENSGWFGSVEGSYLMEDGEQADHIDRLQPVPPNSSRLTGGRAVTRPDGGAFRGGLGYDFGGWTVGLNYGGSWLGDTTSVQPDNDTPPYEGIPVILLNADMFGFGPLPLSEGEVKDKWNRQTADLRFGFDAIDLEGGALHLFGGIRYADIDHWQEVEGVYAPTQRYHLKLRDDDYDGWGPLAGVSGMIFFDEAFGMSASLSGAALFGKRKTQNYGVIAGPNNLYVTEGNTHTSKNTVYNLEAELGFVYSPPMPGGTDFTVTLGYRLDQWWNIHDTTSPQFHISNQAPFYAFDGNRGSKKGDATSHGPFLRLGVQF